MPLAFAVRIPPDGPQQGGEDRQGCLTTGETEVTSGHSLQYHPALASLAAEQLNLDAECRSVD